MICCMADLQFMAFEIEAKELAGGWAVFDALAETGQDEYGQKKVKLKPNAVRFVPPPNSLIIDLKRAP